MSLAKDGGVIALQQSEIKSKNETALHHVKELDFDFFDFLQGTLKAEEGKIMEIEERILKLENPKRVKELNPKNILKKADFQDGMTLCDIGAGTGIFSFAAAEITKEKVYALDVSDAMIEFMEERKFDRGIKNLAVRKVESPTLPMEETSCDLALMITVLHELENPDAMLKEIRRILKEKGRLLIIEFHKETTQSGPPLEHRIAEEKVKELYVKHGFRHVARFTISDNFYAVIVEK